MKEGSGSDPFGDDEEQQDDETSSDQNIPWIFTRESVQSDRSRVQFFLRKEVSQQEGEFISTLEEKLETSVPVTDAREAAYLAAMNNPDKVVDELREWGFHLKD